MSKQQKQRHLLLPVDITNASEDMCAWACDNFFRETDVVTVLSVAKKEVQSHGSSYFGLSHDRSEGEAVKHAHEWIEAHVKPHLAKCGCGVEVLVKLLETDKHHVAEAIIEESKKVNASDANSRYYEAIVLASHKRGAIKEFFLGSVANYVLHHSNITVVVQRLK